MIILRYEVRIRVPGETRDFKHRRFMTHDGASYYLAKAQLRSRHFEVRLYDRKRERYLR